MRIVYFAKVREAVGMEGEERAPKNGMTIAQLLDQLTGEAPHYAQAFTDRQSLRFALDQTMVTSDATLADARELAIFPPVTGG
jgi:sulfur-carrier protein